jgi:nitroreductase
MEAIELIRNHVTVRKYQAVPIEADILNSILEAGCRASTTGNMQVYSIVVTQLDEIKQQLLPCHFNQKMVVEAPVVLTFCADFNRFNKWCEVNNAVPGYNNFLSFTTAAIDALLAAQNVCVAAESMGLGICYLGTTTYMAQQIIDVLKLPKGVVPITTVTLGYPAEIPALTDRLPLEAIIHNNVYSDYSTEDIKRFYSEKEMLPQNRQFVTDNKKETLAQVFTDIRYKKTDNELFGNRLLDVLKTQGFME